MRKFRAIVQTPKEPQDHEVLWYWKGNLLYWNNGGWEPFHTNIKASDIKFESIFFDNKDNVDEVLRALLEIVISNQWKIENAFTVIEADNILTNSFFIDSTKYWLSETLQPFTVGPKFIKVGRGFLSKQRAKAAVIREDGVPVLAVKGSTIPCTLTQPFLFLNLEAIDPDYKFPFYVTLTFKFKGTSFGNIEIATVDQNDESIEIKDTLRIDPDNKWHIYKTTFLLDRYKGIRFNLNADVRIKGLNMRMNEARTLHLKPESLINK